MSKRRGSFFQTNLQPHRRALKDALFKEFQNIPLIKATSESVFEALSRVILKGNPDSPKAITVIETFPHGDRAEIYAILDSYSRRYHALDPRMESANFPGIPHNAAYNAGLGRALGRYTRRVGQGSQGSQEHFRPFRKSSSETRRPRLLFVGNRRVSNIERSEARKAARRSSSNSQKSSK